MVKYCGRGLRLVGKTSVVKCANAWSVYICEHNKSHYVPLKVKDFVIMLGWVLIVLPMRNIALEHTFPSFVMLHVRPHCYSSSIKELH